MEATPDYKPNDRLTEDEFARAVGACRSTLSKLRKEGAIPFCQLGRHVFYLGRHIDAYYAAIEQNRAATSPATHPIEFPARRAK